MIQAIDHIGIAVKNISDAKALYTSLFNVEHFHEERVEEQGVDIASFELQGVRIELTAPFTETSPMYTYLQKRGEGIHHIAFRSNDISADLAHLQSQNINLINSTPTMGAHNMLIAFAHPKSTGGVLMELCMPSSQS